MRAEIVLFTVGGFMLACGGGGSAPAADVTAAPVAAPAAEPKYGSVEFQSYSSDGTWVKFLTNGKAQYGWPNSACDSLTGTWTQEGEQITLLLADPEDCMTWNELKLKQMSDCAIAAYGFKNTRSGEQKDDDTWMFERTEPRCPR